MSIHSTDLLECIDLRNQAGEEEGRFPRRWYKPVTAVIHSQNGDKRVMKKYPKEPLKNRLGSLQHLRI